MAETPDNPFAGWCVVAICYASANTPVGTVTTAAAPDELRLEIFRTRRDAELEVASLLIDDLQAFQAGDKEELDQVDARENYDVLQLTPALFEAWKRSMNLPAALDAVAGTVWRAPSEPDSRTRRYDRKQYDRAAEVVSGVFIETARPGASVYIRDAQGEVVNWNHHEVAEDPGAFVAALSAVALATLWGPTAVRQNLASRGALLQDAIRHTAAKELA